MNTQMITTIFLTVLALRYIVLVWLNIRNIRHISLHSNSVPDHFTDLISIENHKKTARYSISRIKAVIFFSAYDQIILLLWTLGGGIEQIHLLTNTISSSYFINGTCFFAVLLVISTIVAIPQSIWSTFVIEEQYGFNNTTKKLFIIDLCKGLVVSGAIGLPLIAGIIFIMEKLGSLWWVWAWIFMNIFQLFLLILYPRVIAPLFNKFITLPDGEIKKRIKELLKRTGFKARGLFIMDASKRSRHGNAYFTGFGKEKRIVFFDTLVEKLIPSEIEAVLAHELGHYKKKHVIKKMAALVIFSLFAFYILGLLYTWPVFYHGHGSEYQTTWIALALFIFISTPYTFFVTPIQAWFSRRHEFEADDFAARFSNASDLINSLKKMYRDNASTLTPDPLFSRFYYSHPPAVERIKNLMKHIGDNHNETDCRN
ncbi:MAG: M48 family metallopeptidase [Bacteriovoracaceae bacterium]|nr:M48 family metallopeptidase [Bacteriovoracaceae bacterium]